MNSFIDRLRQNNPAIFWLLAISLGVTLLGLILDVIHRPEEGSYGWSQYLMMPSRIGNTIKQPWGILTYPFLTPLNGRLFLGFILNVVFIYQFGRILQSFIGERKVRALIIFAIQFNALIVLLICSLVPAAKQGDQYLFGLSAITVTLITAAITVAPKYPIQLVIFGRLALVWVGIVLIAFKFISHQAFVSWPEMVSLVSGVALGFGHIKLTKEGTDIPLQMMEFFEGLLDNTEKKPKMKVVYRKSESKPASESSSSTSSEDEIDHILDRINEVGYEKLTRREKEILAGLSDDEK